MVDVDDSSLYTVELTAKSVGLIRRSAAAISRNDKNVMMSSPIIVVNYFLSWYFIPRVLKLANVKMYVPNCYDGD